MTPGDLVEREREIAALAELLDAAPAGEGRVAWIEGPAGIGKSTLLAEARRRSAGGSTRMPYVTPSAIPRRCPGRARAHRDQIESRYQPLRLSKARAGQHQQKRYRTQYSFAWAQTRGMDSHLRRASV